MFADCDPDTYGASCRSHCHCADGVSCEPDTGVCDGKCHPDWYGVNCQCECTRFSSVFGNHKPLVNVINSDQNLTLIITSVVFIKGKGVQSVSKIKK